MQLIHDSVRSRQVLMIAFHFPPLVGSSGIQRTLRFSQYLPSFGWRPIVLAPSTRAYPETSVELMGEISSSTVVRRAFALDARRHLSIRGRYPRLAALPDRWSSWWLGAVPLGLSLIRELRPDVIWSTSPIVTAHAIGWTLSRISGLPWIAELRDPLVQAGHPADPWVRRTCSWIEQRIAATADRVVFVAPGAARKFKSSYSQFDQRRVSVIENGYDEEAFVRATSAHTSPSEYPNRFTLLHSGVLYENARDPKPLFSALRELARGGLLQRVEFKLVLRASGQDRHFAELAREAGVAQWVNVMPAIGYGDALEEMLSADGLLLMQGAICNDQIPAKLYEYLRAGRPILALTDRSGDCGRLLQNLGIDTVAPLEKTDAIVEALGSFIERVQTGRAPIAEPARIAAYSRESLSGRVAQLLDEVLQPFPKND